jgi:hypothetical protein
VGGKWRARVRGYRGVQSGMVENGSGARTGGPDVPRIPRCALVLSLMVEAAAAAASGVQDPRSASTNLRTTVRSCSVSLSCEEREVDEEAWG